MLRMLQFDSDFYNFWILKGLVLIGNRSNLSFSIIRFSSTKIFVVMKQFFKPLLIVQSIYLCKRQLFCWWFLIVFHEFLCYFCSCSFRKSLVFISYPFLWLLPASHVNQILTASCILSKVLLAPLYMVLIVEFFEGQSSKVY